MAKHRDRIIPLDEKQDWGPIRYALMGIFLAAFGMGMIKPLCWFMVTSGTWLEAIVK